MPFTGCGVLTVIKDEDNLPYHFIQQAVQGILLIDGCLYNKSLILVYT